MLVKKIRYNSPVVLTFVILSLLALGLNRLTNGESNRLVFSVYNSSWLDPLTYLRLFCHPLGHMNWAHLSSNMMLLLLTGPMLEEKYGSLRLFLIMLITAVITGFIQMLFFDTALLGASGIVFAFIILCSMTGLERGGIPLTFLIITGIYLGGEIYAAVTIKDNISQITHIAGGLVGAISGFAFLPKKAKLPSAPEIPVTETLVPKEPEVISFPTEQLN